MHKKVNPIPEGYRTITPHLSLKDAARAIQFYKDAFDAIEIKRHNTDDGQVLHAVIKIGDSLVMIANEFPDQSCGISSPQSLKGTTTLLHLYLEDVDATFDRAVAAGAKVMMPMTNMFWGDRYGQLEDPFGHAWALSMHIFDVSDEDMPNEV
ncbi:MAG: VOC family protein [Parachlamydiaceae bacterium]|nr:VOC family protein [Parachlamydiaceae bacterium]